MYDWRSSSHVRWECKYHVVITPKYRKKVFFGKKRHQIGEIIRELCRQRGIEPLEGHAMPDEKQSGAFRSRSTRLDERCESHNTAVTIGYLL